MERFPDDGFLVGNGLDGYLAVPMRGAGGDVVGYVCVISRTRVDAGEEEVAVLPFGQLDEDVVSAESAGGATLEQWLASHREFYAGCRDEIALLLGEPGWRLTDGEPMVVTSFRLAE